MLAQEYKAVAIDSQTTSVATSVEQSPVKAKQHEYILLPNEWKLMIIIYFGVLIGAIAFNLAVVFPTNLSSIIATFIGTIIPSNYPAIHDLLFSAVLLGLSVKFSKSLFICKF